MDNDTTLMEDLCHTYWHPLHALIQRRGYDPHDADDLTQEFFARLLQSPVLLGLARAGDRCWSYLLTALKCFLVNEWHRQRCRKRGGGAIPVCLDDAATERYARDLTEAHTPATLLERRWALLLLERVLDQLRGEYAAAGKEELFERLRCCLPGAEDHANYADIAADLHVNEPAARMAAYRLRRRYGELLREEIAKTVSRREDIDDEIRSIIAATRHQERWYGQG